MSLKSQNTYTLNHSKSRLRLSIASLRKFGIRRFLAVMITFKKKNHIHSFNIHFLSCFSENKNLLLTNLTNHEINHWAKRFNNFLNINATSRQFKHRMKYRAE